MIPDTSAEAVERRIRELQEAGFDNGAAMLRALLAERDEADGVIAVWRRRTTEAEAERDRLAVEVGRLREALTKLADAAQFAPLDLSRALTNARAALAGEKQA